jgi:hypothetical protein
MDMSMKQNDMARTIRMANWEALRWRRLEWARIPYPSRVPVLPYLSVEDNVAFNSALRNKHDRKHFLKSYKDKRLPDFDRYVYTDANDFAVLRWVMKKGVDVQGLTLHLKAPGIEDRDKVLLWLVKNGHGEIASVYCKGNAVRDVNGTGGRTTLYHACKLGLVGVARALVEGGASIDKAKDNGCTPLLIASHNGHVETVRLLIEKGASIDKAEDNGWTPLIIASQNVHFETVRLLIEKGASIDKAKDNGWTPLTAAIIITARLRICSSSLARSE